jgi:hypothetical protein
MRKENIMTEEKNDISVYFQNRSVKKNKKENKKQKK